MTDITAQPADAGFRYELTDSTLVFACCLLSAGASLIFNAYPVVLGTLAERFGLGEAQMGMLGSAYMAGAAAVALVAPWWLTRLNWKRMAITGVAMMLGSVVMLEIVTSVEAAYLLMAISGCGAIIVYSLALNVLSRHHNPERVYGLKYTLEVGSGALFVILVTKFVIDSYGYSGFIIAMLLVYSALLFPIVKIPDNFLQRELKATTDSKHTILNAGAAAWLSALALLVQCSVFYSMWGFIEKIGLRHGAEAGFINTAIAVSIVAGMGGAMISSWIGNRWRQIKPLVVILTGWVIAIVLLSLNISAMSFLVGSSILIALFWAWSTYQIGYIAEVDPGGRMFLLVPFFFTAGGAFGPAIVGAIIEDRGYGLSFLIWGLTTVAVLALNLLAAAWYRRDQAP